MSWMLTALGVGLRRYEVGNAERMTRRIDQDPPVIGIGLKFGLHSAQGEDSSLLTVEVRDR